MLLDVKVFTFAYFVIESWKSAPDYFFGGSVGGVVENPRCPGSPKDFRSQSGLSQHFDQNFQNNFRNVFLQALSTFKTDWECPNQFSEVFSDDEK